MSEENAKTIKEGASALERWLEMTTTAKAEYIKAASTESTINSDMAVYQAFAIITIMELIEKMNDNLEIITHHLEEIDRTIFILAK